MNCPIVHVVQVIKKGKKINKNVCRVYHSLKNNIPIDSCGATFHNPGLKTSFTCWTTGLGEQLAASLHHLQLCYRGSCLSSHLEEKWPRVIDRNSAATDFILTQWGKTQPQEGFFFFWKVCFLSCSKIKAGFSAAKEFSPFESVAGSLTRDSPR